MPVLKKMPGDAIKTMPATDGRRRIGGYIVRFTDENDTDLHGQWFSKATDFGREFWSIVGKPVLVEHGLDPAFKSMPIGVFDLEREDDIGIYAEAWLYGKQEYIDMLSKRREQKRLDWTDEVIQRKAGIVLKAVDTFLSMKPHWSSGALPQTVEVDDKTQHIDVWQPIEASTTHQAAEPDGTDTITMRSVLDEVTPYLQIQTDTPLHEGGNVGDGQPARKDARDSADVENRNSNPAKERKAMTPEEMQTLVQMVLDGMAAMLNKQEAEETPLPTPEQVMAAVNPADSPDKDPEEVAKFVVEKSYGYVRQFIADKQKSAKAGRNHLARIMEAPDTLPAGGNGNGKSNGIIEMTDLKYARLSAGEMALGVLMAQAPMKAAGIRANPNISEGYIRNMTGKAHDLAWRDNAGLTAEQKHAFKSIVPYKANELDASNIVGQGYEWVSQFWSSTIWEAARFVPTLYDKMVSKGMHVEEVPQGAESVYFPTEGSDPVVYSSPQANSGDATGRPEVTANISPFSTGRVQLTPRELKLATAFTVILEEDSIINIVKQVNSQINKKMLETRDQVIINGDTETANATNINLIDGQPGTGLNAPYYLNSNGLRKLPLVTNTALKRDGGALTIADYLATLGLLAAVLRTNKAESLFIVDPGTELATMALPELATLDVAGRYATIENGEITMIYGREVVATGFLPLTNNAGKVPAAGGTLGTIIAVFAPYWGFGWKRQITIETDRDILSGSNIYVASMRMGIVPRGTTGSALSYNMTV